MNKKQLEQSIKLRQDVYVAVRLAYVRLGYDGAMCELHNMLNSWKTGFLMAAGPSRVRQAEEVEEMRQEVFQYVQERLLAISQKDTLQSLVYDYSERLRMYMLINELPSGDDYLIKLGFAIREMRGTYRAEVEPKLQIVMAQLGVAYIDLTKALDVMMRDAEFRTIMHHS